MLCGIFSVMLLESFYTEHHYILLSTIWLFVHNCTKWQLSTAFVKLMWIIQVSVPGPWWISHVVGIEVAGGSSAQVICHLLQMKKDLFLSKEENCPSASLNWTLCLSSHFKMIQDMESGSFFIVYPTFCLFPIPQTVVSLPSTRADVVFTFLVWSACNQMFLCDF